MYYVMIYLCIIDGLYQFVIIIFHCRLDIKPEDEICELETTLKDLKEQSNFDRSSKLDLEAEYGVLKNTLDILDLQFKCIQEVINKNKEQVDNFSLRLRKKARTS